MRRRDLLGMGCLGLAGLRLARAGAPSGRRFVFVVNYGGWDPLLVFAPLFGAEHVEMEADAAPAQVGGIPFVDHPDRPSVRAFMDTWHGRSVVLNGVMVRSIAHEICTMIAMTGTTSGLDPDWPAILAGREAELYTLPHFVLGGPSFPGDLGVAVARTGTNGQLQALLSGAALDQSDVAVGGIRSPSESIVDRYLARRAGARVLGARSAFEARLMEDYEAALAHAAELKDLQYLMDFNAGADLLDQAPVAVDALALGVSRCVTLNAGGAFSWDTHANNDAEQSVLWETMFYGLGQLMTLLQGAPGASGGSLLDETVVVVMSEMGRTPQLNGFNGKDHWPFGSALIVGPNVTGSRVVGDFDRSWYGRNVDPASAEVSDGGQVLSFEAVGATILAMADVDPGEYVSGVEPLTGILR